MISDISSPIPTSSALVELSVFNFCLFEFELTAPWTMVIIIPVWLFMSRCTPNAASTYHWRVFVLSIPSMRGRPMVDQMYLMIWVRLFQSSLYRYFALVQRKMPPNCRSGMDFLARHSRFSITWWNVMVSYWFRLSWLSSFKINKWYQTGVAD